MPMNLASTRKFYPDDEELIVDIVKGYKKVIADLYAAGCRNIQFDDCTWGCFVDPKANLFFDADDDSLEVLQKQFLTINNLAIEASRTTWSSIPISAAAISILPGHAPADMIKSHRWSLDRKTSMPIIWNLTMSAPEALNR